MAGNRGTHGNAATISKKGAFGMMIGFAQNFRNPEKSLKNLLLLNKTGNDSMIKGQSSTNFYKNAESSTNSPRTAGSPKITLDLNGTLKVFDGDLGSRRSGISRNTTRMREIALLSRSSSAPKIDSPGFEEPNLYRTSNRFFVEPSVRSSKSIEQKNHPHVNMNPLYKTQRSGRFF